MIIQEESLIGVHPLSENSLAIIEQTRKTKSQRFTLFSGLCMRCVHVHVQRVHVSTLYSFFFEKRNSSNKSNIFLRNDTVMVLSMLLLLLLSFISIRINKIKSVLNVFTHLDSKHTCTHIHSSDLDYLVCADGIAHPIFCCLMCICS